jgi:hypothetical protein
MKQISQQPPPAVPSANKLPPLPQLQPGNWKWHSKTSQRT